MRRRRFREVKRLDHSRSQGAVTPVRPMLRSPRFSQDAHCSAVELFHPAGFPTHRRPGWHASPHVPKSVQSLCLPGASTLLPLIPPTPVRVSHRGRHSQGGLCFWPNLIFKGDFRSKYLWQNTESAFFHWGLCLKPFSQHACI